MSKGGREGERGERSPGKQRLCHNEEERDTF